MQAFPHFVNHHLTCSFSKHQQHSNRVIQSCHYGNTVSFSDCVCSHLPMSDSIFVMLCLLWSLHIFCTFICWLLAMTHWWIITAEWKCGVLCTTLCVQRDSWCKYQMCLKINGEGKKTGALSLEIMAHRTLPASEGCPARPPDLAGNVFSHSARSGRSARPHCFPSPVTAQLLSVDTWLGVNNN